MRTNYSALDKVLDQIMQLDFSSREMIIDIVKKRQIEDRREGIAKNARNAQDEFLKGRLRPKSAANVIKKLKTL